MYVMAAVAGVDFGTLSVRVSIVDSEMGRIGSSTAEYPLHRKKGDPDHATQKHEDHLEALVRAMRGALAEAGIPGEDIVAIAVDTTGSSVVPVDDRMQPLDDYYLWCDHRATAEAEQITKTAKAAKLPAIDWCGGSYSCEWGFAKLLHWLRHNSDKRSRMASAFEHCDVMGAVLCGITEPSKAPRSVCAMGHKWMYNEELGGLPPETFLASVDPLLRKVREKLDGTYTTSDHIAGLLGPEWARKLGLREGIPVPA
jgi:L-ribulokinase